MRDRYDVGLQREFEPGSEGRVLCNKLGVANPEEMDEIELRLLQQLYEEVLVEALPDRTLRVADLKAWHRHWLGNVYAWAGDERSVNLSKGSFPFAAAAQISRLLAVFERDCLARFTPCHDLAGFELADAIATTHVEFILIHPFREGNGRISRLLSDVMAVQAGRGPLDYTSWDVNKHGYFTGIQIGMTGNYEPMRRLVEQALAA